MKDIAYRVQTIAHLHEIVGFEKPRHPLVSVIDYSKVKVANAPDSGSFICSFYTVNFKKNCHFMYGRQPFDHQEGTLHCTVPGKNTREHIHYHLLEKAKNLLAGTEKSINEIAYELGFEYPQSFCKLFKRKVGSSPTEYRNEIFKN